MDRACVVEPSACRSEDVCDDRDPKGRYFSRAQRGVTEGCGKVAAGYSMMIPTMTRLKPSQRCLNAVS
jgi:hypothetical protein